jgi:nucleoside-diphosphate-sugar epimerase
MGGYSIPVELGYVDVDDVALAHLRAIEVTEADGHRIIIAESQIMWQEIQKELSSIANETTTGVEKNFSQM